MPTLWESLEEPDILDTTEFEYLFSKDITQEKRKPLSETYEKKTKAKKVFIGFLFVFFCVLLFSLSFWENSLLIFGFFVNEQASKFWIADSISILLLENAGLLFTLEDVLPLIMKVPHPSEVEKNTM